MTTIRHLWAIGFDDMGRADQVRDEITRLCQHADDLTLKDVAVVVRHPDGSFTLNREPLAAVKYFLDCAAIGFITGLVLAAPMFCTPAGAGVGATDIAASAPLGIDRDFIREVQGLMRPGSSALFVLDEVGNMDKTKKLIRGLGGTVLRTNVDLERAKLVQSTLAASLADATEPHGR
jgi:uncharacterized membrane protein